MNDSYISPKDATRIYGIDRYKLEELERTNAVRVERTSGGHRRYSEKDLRNIAKRQTRSSAIFGELGSTGLSKWNQDRYREKLRELRGISGYNIYREMRLNDPVISAVFFALVNALRQANWRVKPASDKPADRRAAEFVEECLGDLSWSWEDQLTFIVDPMLEQGFSYLEITYKYRRGEKNKVKSLFDDNRIGWRKWAPRPAESLVEGDEWVYDENGGILGANQSGEKGKIFLPIEKCLLFRTTVHPANSPWGVPIHRSMYLSWWYSQNIQEIEGIGIERDLAGIPVIYLGSDCTVTGEGSDYELAKNLVVNIRNDEQVGVVVPKPKMGTGSNPGEGMLLELLNTGGSKEFDTTKIIERYDKRKAISVLAQFILLGMDNIGSYALSKNQSDLFVLAARAWLFDIAGIINRHAVPKLIQYNVFPRITGYPKLIPGALGIPDLETISNYVNRLVQSAVLTPDEELERHLRQIGGLPALEVTVHAEGKSPNKDKKSVNGKDKSEDEMKDETENEIETRDEAKNGIKKASHVGYRILDSTEKELERYWGDFIDRVDRIEQEQRRDRDELLAALLLLLTADVERLIRQNLTNVWVEVNGDASGATYLIEDAVNEYMGYFRNFMNEIKEKFELGGMIPNVREELGKYTNRFVSYAGSVWRLYNEAKIWLAPRDSIWEWRGPNDERTCIDCGAEILAGPRPLWQISRRPGTVACLSNCRCELIRLS